MTRTSQPPEHRARAAPANALATNVRTIADLEQEALLERSAAERIADRVVRLTGRGTFALLHVGWFGLWVLANVGLIPGVTAVDPYPFSFLTFVVSLEAIFLSILVLISQNSLTRQAEQRAHLDLQINLLAEQESTATLRVLQRLCRHVGLDEETHDATELTEKTDVHGVATELKAKLPIE